MTALISRALPRDARSIARGARKVSEIHAGIEGSGSASQAMPGFFVTGAARVAAGFQMESASRAQLSPQNEFCGNVHGERRDQSPLRGLTTASRRNADFTQFTSGACCRRIHSAAIIAQNRSAPLIITPPDDGAIATVGAPSLRVERMRAMAYQSAAPATSAPPAMSATFVPVSMSR